MGVLFVVRYLNQPGTMIASAFFPNDPPSRRRVFIFPSYAGTSFDKVGVLRHELGHVLGFRHEHIRSEAPAVCQGEDTGFTLSLSNYDPHSVMHYLCGGAGNPGLTITDIDRISAQQVYGPPLTEFSFAEQ